MAKYACLFISLPLPYKKNLTYFHVKTINVKAGETVEEGRVLVELD